MKNHKNIFILGTDTDIGKTFISQAILQGWRSSAICYWKPVQAGGPDGDAQIIHKHHPRKQIYPSSYVYPSALSPDQAAAQDGMHEVSLPHLLKCWRECQQQSEELLVVEGAGGLLVPLNQSNQTWCDFLVMTQIPIVLVARSGLGTLNHTSLTLEHLYQIGLTPILVVLNGEPHPENLKSLKRRYPKIKFHMFPDLPAWQLPLDDRCADLELCQQLAASVADALTQTAEQKAADLAHWQQRDRQMIWHPFTQHQTAPSPIALTRARGCYVFDDAGRQLFDGTASWWVNTIGHGHPEVAKAIAHQQQVLDHVMFAGVSHQPAAQLSERLIAKSQGQLQRVFYSDNGSTAVEVALKLAIQWHHNRGASKRRLLTLHAAYHGDTVGAMSLSGHQGFYGMFKDLMFSVDQIHPFTSHVSIHSDKVHHRQQGWQIAQEYLDRYSDELAAVVVEPFVQGAGGMLVQDEEWLVGFCEMVNQRNIPLIFDEVFVGLGRLGYDYAFLRRQLRPDLVCVAKGLTGGNLPLAATLVTEEIYRGFCDDDRGKAFFHGHSFTANPISCAAALATDQVYTSEGLCRRALAIERRFQHWIERYQNQNLFSHPRACGAILAFELAGESAVVADYFHHRSYDIITQSQNHGLLLRPLGNTLYLVPPLIVSDEELDDALDRLVACLTQLMS